MNIKGFCCSFLIAIVGFLIVGCSNNVIDTSKEEKSQVNVYLDAISFFNDDKTATSTEKDIIEIYGEPEYIEEWNYDRMSDGKTYAIRTLSYTKENGEYWEFLFNNDMLHRISISVCSIQFENKNDVLSLFGCKKNSSTKITDTNAALRFKNCSIYDLWAWSIEDNAIKGIKLSFSNIFE